MTQLSSTVKNHYKNRLPIHKSKSLNAKFVDAEQLHDIMTIHGSFNSWLRKTLEAYGAKRRIDYLVLKKNETKKVVFEVEFAAELAKANNSPSLATYLYPQKKGG